MSTQRIGDLPEHRLVEFKPCTHPEHLPHSHVVLPPGVYRHTCPSCGDSFEFSVWDGPTLDAMDKDFG